MLPDPLPAPASSVAVPGLPGDSIAALAATAGDSTAWVVAAAVAGVGLILLAGAGAVIAARRRSASADTARRRPQRTDRLDRPVDPAIIAALDRRAARRAGARPGGEEA
jgi:hypothetical protein